MAHFNIRIKTIVHLYNLSQLLNSDILFEKVLGFFVFCCEAAPVQSSCDAEIRASFLQKHKSGMRTPHLSLSSYLPQKSLSYYIVTVLQVMSYLDVMWIYLWENIYNAYFVCSYQLEQTSKPLNFVFYDSFCLKHSWKKKFNLNPSKLTRASAWLAMLFAHYWGYVVGENVFI